MAIAAHPRPAQFLRRVVQADLFVSGAAGLLQLAAAEPLARATAIDAAWLRGAGLVLMAWIAFLGWTLTRRAIAGRPSSQARATRAADTPRCAPIATSSSTVS